MANAAKKNEIEDPQTAIKEPKTAPHHSIHGTGLTRTVAAGEFKAKCLSLLDEVAETRETIIVTKFGKPVAQVEPMPLAEVELFGAMRGSVLWEGDIISPIEDAWDWEATR